MKKPTPEEVKSARAAADLTQKQAAAVIYEQLRSWQRYEEGSREMSCALYELFMLKTGQMELKLVAKPEQ